MRDQKQVTIDGYDYLITQFGARKGVKLGKKVGRVILPAIAKIYDSSNEFDISAVIQAVAENLDELEEETIEELLSETTCNKYAIDFDKHFAGKYSSLFKLLWEIIDFNFASIFSEVPGVTEE